jgi:hypothetical protein
LGLRKAHEYVPIALIGIPADEVFSNPRAAGPLKFSACFFISQIRFSDVVEVTTLFGGRGAGRVYETSSAWMPMRATGKYLCGLINPTCAGASQMKGPFRIRRTASQYL